MATELVTQAERQRKYLMVAGDSVQPEPFQRIHKACFTKELAV